MARQGSSKKPRIIIGVVLIIGSLLAGVFFLPDLIRNLNLFDTTIWGEIANDLYEDQNVKTTLFFAGPPNPNSIPLYTRHPQNPSSLDWSSDTDIDFSLSQIRNAGINTMKISYWGHQGETDAWSPSLLFSQQDWNNPSVLLSEMEIIAKADHFFSKSQDNQLLFAPLLEVSGVFPFYSEFPGNLSNIVSRIDWLVSNFAHHSNWLRIYDQNGQERIAIFLIETIHLGTIDPAVFAQGFMSVASQIETLTGEKIGFIIDPTPLPPYGSTEGPVPAILENLDCILAVNPFNIVSQGVIQNPTSAITESQRLDYAESVVSLWSNSSIPFITPFLPGYDANLVFPTSDIYGFSDTWLNSQKTRLFQYPNQGVSFDCWNGYTEGYAIVPTVEDGTRIYDWATSITSGSP